MKPYKLTECVFVGMDGKKIQSAPATVRVNMNHEEGTEEWDKELNSFFAADVHLASYQIQSN